MVTLSPYLARLPRRASNSSTREVLSVQNERICWKLRSTAEEKIEVNWQKWRAANHLQDVYITQRDCVLHLGKLSKLEAAGLNLPSLDCRCRLRVTPHAN
jgi:hypothetical protein